MNRSLRIFALLFCVSQLYATDDAVRAIHGTITKIDSAAKSMTLKAADGREQILHIVDKTLVQTADASGKLVRASWRDLKEGTEVVAHYTKRGAEDVALEVDKVGRDGLKTVEVTLKVLDTAGKKLTVEAGRGVEETFWLTEHAVKSAATDVGKLAEKGARVTVYYTEEAGKKTAHFFERR